MKAAQVTSGPEDLPKEKALLDVAVKAKIDQAKKDCSPEALEPLIKATIKAETGSDNEWADKEEAEKKLLDLDIKLMKLIQDRIQVNINAELLSKDCTEKITNTEIAPAEEPFNAESVEPEPEAAEEPAPEAPAPVPEEAPIPEPEATEPAPEAPAPIPEEASAPETPAPVPEAAPEGCTKGKGGINICVNVDANVDPKFVCKSGCKDAKDAKVVLNLRVNLEKEFQPRLDKFYEQEIPTECEEKRTSLVDSVLDLLNLNVKVMWMPRSMLKVDTEGDTKVALIAKIMTNAKTLSQITD
ncbi:hypothetical protein BGX26_009927 [Mortierella sp. AD094]|nr:hypothetical protein BGX26_009927 [Mortierella sp. AD094]